MSDSSTGIALIVTAGAVAAAASLWWFAGPGPSPEPASLGETAPRQWAESGTSESGGRSLELRLDSRRGPVLQSDDGPVALTPLPDDWSPDSWNRRQADDRVVVTGRGQTRGHTLEVRWQFASGNPQARLRYRLEDVPAETLDESRIALGLSLPEGTTELFDSTMQRRTLPPSEAATVGPWHPHWLHWSGDGGDITFSGWTGDQLGIGPRSDGSRAVTFDIWSASRHFPPASCQPSGDADDGRQSFDLGARMTVTFGSAPPVVPTPFPRGRAAAVVPIFDSPSSHPDQTLHIGAARTAEDWVRRVRTLTHGHSSTDDPRFGNGGLLGHGLGGTVVLPERFADDDNVRQFVSQLADSPADIALRTGNPSRSTPDGIRISSTSTCTSPDSEDADATTPAGIIPGFHSADHGLVDLLAADPPQFASPSHLHPVAFSPARLSGSRDALLEETLHRDRLRKLVRARGIAAFATPLLGSRNPLVPAAKEALLSAERRGQWTLSSPFTESLADLELWADMFPVWVTGTSHLLAHWPTARQTDLRWSSDGTLEVVNRSDTPLPGFTLLAADLSDSDVTVDGDPPDGRRRSDASPATWLWWTLEPGESHRVQFDGDYTFEPPSPVQWTWTD